MSWVIYRVSDTLMGEQVKQYAVTKYESWDQANDVKNYLNRQAPDNVYFDIEVINDGKV